ncbi:MAG: hypothetical protein IIY88_02055 [Eubacterium sp.]|nr:hypothetical protein [Eubacterium sp.]
MSIGKRINKKLDDVGKMLLAILVMCTVALAPISCTALEMERQFEMTEIVCASVTDGYESYVLSCEDGEFRAKNSIRAVKAQIKLEKAQAKEYLEKEEERKAKERYERAEAEAWANTNRTFPNSSWSGRVLSPGAGTIMGPSGKETFYNLNMGVVVSVMRRMGFSEEEYPYEVREDGVKTLGGFVMVAANLDIRPRGSFIMTSCGVGIVCDTGGFAKRNRTQLDLAVTW